MMNAKTSILVVGAGYVGLATAVFFASKGYATTVVEQSSRIVSSLNKGTLHFYEPVLQRKLQFALKRKLLQFRLPEQQAYQQADYIFIAIDSANRNTGKMNIHHFKQIAEWIGNVQRKRRTTVILKSTNIIGFAEQFRALLKKTRYGNHINLIVNPEFLREGYAFEDTAKPWRIVVGADEKQQAAGLLRLYRNIYPKSIPMVVTNCKSAELIKLASNVYLAYRLSFIHEIAEFARQELLDIESIKQGIGLDPRIGFDYFNPGLGFGGSCLPKDCKLMNSPEMKQTFPFESARTALKINTRLLHKLVNNLKHHLHSIRGKQVALLGIAFKPGVDDTRDSQALKLARMLVKEGARVAVYDPYITETKKQLANHITLYPALDLAIQGASVVIIGTAHQQFATLKPSHVARQVKKKIIYDYYHMLNRSSWQKAGFEII